MIALAAGDSKATVSQFWNSTSGAITPTLPNVSFQPNPPTNANALPINYTDVINHLDQKHQPVMLEGVAGSSSGPIDHWMLAVGWSGKYIIANDPVDRHKS